MPTEDLSYLSGPVDPHRPPPHHSHNHHPPPPPTSSHHHHHRYPPPVPLPHAHGRRYYSNTETTSTSKSSSSNMSIAITATTRPSSATPPTSGSGPNSGGGAGGGPLVPPRTTATSRRGGRTRSRSPPVMGGRSGSIVDASPPPHIGGGPENPSSAAAAAAAAAKAFSSSERNSSTSERGGGGGRQSSTSWPPEGGLSGSGRDHHDSYSSSRGGGYSGGGGGSSNWPGDDGRGGTGSSSYSRYSGGGGGGGGYGGDGYGHGGRGGGAGTGGSSGAGYHSSYGPRGPPTDDRAYGGGGSSERGRDGSRHHPHHYDDRGGGHFRGSTAAASHRGQASYPPDSYNNRYASSSSQRESSGNPKNHPSSSSSRSGGGGTSLVLGGTTPIHVPKPVEAPSSSSSGRSRGGRSNPSSVFRRSGGGGGGDTSSRSSAAPGGVGGNGAGVDEDSPQRILLSLRTPTSSFEENRSERTKKSGNLPLSPEDPPTIQNSNQQRPSDQLFDARMPQRSPEANKLSASIETAPSFSLFTQSFDSFGDGHYSLQNDSFCMVRAGSVDADGGVIYGAPSNTTQMILQSPSVGNFSQQLLASGSGALTLGYSPVNSFGNVSTSGGGGPQRGPTMMVVGGTEARASSPTQVLGMYRSYSGGGGGNMLSHQRPIPGPGGPGPGGPLEDSHLRLSMGSFGSPSMAHSRSYGGEPTSSSPHPSYYYQQGPSRSHENLEKRPSFHSFLRKNKNAFKDCTFLLPGLKEALLETARNEAGDTVRSIPNGGDGARKAPPSLAASVFGDPTTQDTAVACRRVECSIFAFGGNPNRERRHNNSVNSRPTTEKSSDRSSIFRGKDDSDKAKASPTSTTSSNTPAGSSQSRSRAKVKYEEGLPARYYENESRLSWEFEETPPVEVSQDEDNDSDRGDGCGDSKSPSQGDSKGGDQSRLDGDDSVSRAMGDGESADKRNAGSPQPKMRYRCKLCGQPKQNHTCPYQQSLARSIGIMVFPAVNAFTAAEPGTIAPALSDMNNFIDSQKEGSQNDVSPNRPTPDRPHRRLNTSGTVTSTTQVTPESMRWSPRQLHSPVSFSATPGPTPSHRNATARPVSAPVSSRKRTYAHVSGSDEQCDLLFLESMELKPEQFRSVFQPSASKAAGAFDYPSLPLPYAQRKRLSDNLFSLSNEVPKLTDECAQVLREAREKDMWDLAVAELMTQVIVIIHCPEGDNRFEGLRQYLLTLGIAC